MFFLGLRIELLLEDGKVAMVQETTTVTTSACEISNATLNLQSYLLSDVVLRCTLTQTQHTLTHLHTLTQHTKNTRTHNSHTLTHLGP